MINSAHYSFYIITVTVPDEVKMPDELYEFSWTRNESGYRWLRTRSAIDGKTGRSPELFLTDGNPVGPTYGNPRYLPLEDHTALFRIFADTDPTEEGILEFANKYGFLGHDPSISIPIKLPNDGGEVLGLGESIQSWKKEISIILTAVTLWDLAESNDIKELKKFIHWKGKHTVIYKFGIKSIKRKGKWPKFQVGRSIIAMDENENDRFRPELMARFRPGDLNHPARCHVQNMINDRIEGLVSSRMLWESERDRLSLYFVPSSLLGAMWLQFAQAIDGDKKYRRCQECRKPYEISPEKARTSKFYCSNACRSKNYRDRQAKARKMSKEGKTLEFIAENLNTNKETARGWVEAKKGRK